MECSSKKIYIFYYTVIDCSYIYGFINHILQEKQHFHEKMARKFDMKDNFGESMFNKKAREIW